MVCVVETAHNTFTEVMISLMLLMTINDCTILICIVDLPLNATLVIMLYEHNDKYIMDYFSDSCITLALNI